MAALVPDEKCLVFIGEKIARQKSNQTAFYPGPEHPLAKKSPNYMLVGALLKGRVVVSRILGLCPKSHELTSPGSGFFSSLIEEAL